MAEAMAIFVIGFAIAALLCSAGVVVGWIIELIKEKLDTESKEV